MRKLKNKNNILKQAIYEVTPQKYVSKTSTLQGRRKKFRPHVEHFHPFPTAPRHYLRPSTESFVLKFKSTLQSVFYTRAPAILIVHKARNSYYYYVLPLRYWVLHLPNHSFNISTKSPTNLVFTM